MKIKMSGHGFAAYLFYSGLTLNQDKATKPQTVFELRRGNAVMV